VRFNWNPADADEIRYDPIDQEELTNIICDDGFDEKDDAPEEADFQGDKFKPRGISLDGIVLEAGANA